MSHLAIDGSRPSGLSPTHSTAPGSVPAGPASPGRSVFVPGVLASLAAAAVTTAIAATASAAGVSFADGTGASIPLGGFTMLTVLFALLGVGLAAVLCRWVARPRPVFVRTTVVLLVLSFIPDLSSGFAADSAVVLILAHIAAAVIVIPVLARRLERTR